MSVIVYPVDLNPFRINLLSDRVSDTQFINLCARNPNSRLERKANGDIEIALSAFSKVGKGSGEIGRQLSNWAHTDRTGRVTESSGGFLLPDTAIVAPSAVWTRKERVAALSEQEREGFFPLCPDFVIELRSSGDRLQKLQEKMLQ